MNYGQWLKSQNIVLNEDDICLSEEGTCENYPYDYMELPLNHLCGNEKYIALWFLLCLYSKRSSIKIEEMKLQIFNKSIFIKLNDCFNLQHDIIDVLEEMFSMQAGSNLSYLAGNITFRGFNDDL